MTEKDHFFVRVIRQIMLIMKYGIEGKAGGVLEPGEVDVSVKRGTHRYQVKS